MGNHDIGFKPPIIGNAKTGACKESLNLCGRKMTLEQIIYYAKFLQVPGQAIVILDEKKVIRYCNPVAENLFGTVIKNAVGKGIDVFYSAIVNSAQTEMIYNHLVAGESWSSEIEVSKNDGFELWLINSFSPIIDEEGQVLGSICIFTDISDEKWAERELGAYAQEFSGSVEKIQELNDKLRVVGGLTRHDVRNKLSALTGTVYLLKKSCVDNQSAIAHISVLDKITKDIVQILDFEQIYEQIGSQEIAPVEVQKFFAEATALISDLRGIKVDCQCSGLTVLADSLLRQLLYNLIDNTLKYGQKTTLIKLYFKENSSGLQLVYGDNGVGIPEEVRQHLFEKGFGKGTGLGLYMMKRICETYGWVISEQGQPDEGARFVMAIPLGKYMITPHK